MKKKIRKFETGATRDSAKNKPEYVGFLSPLVLKSFGKYMTKHRKQSDGELRASNNWKKGIPVEEYIQSLMRHFIDLWLHFDGFPKEARESEEDAWNGVLFNIQGYAYERLKKNDKYT